MLKNIPLFPAGLISFLTLLLFSCAAEDLGEVQIENINSINLAVIELEDLNGRWELVSMTSDVAVDFNDEDNIAHHDLMEETDCFDDMFYEFHADGNVTAHQAKLHFDATGIISCDREDYSAPFSLKDDMLTISFLHNEELVQATKQITLSADKKTLEIELTRLEASTYIKNDSGTSTAPIQMIRLVFEKIS